MAFLDKWGYRNLKNAILKDISAKNYDARYTYKAKGWHGGYPEERSGGYREERDYYPEERRGGYNRNERDYYPDEMHGGNLGLFRNEIRNNLTNLRQEILNITL